MNIPRLFLVLYPGMILSSLFAQEKIDHDIISQIKEEGFNHSQVMETLSWITDVYGPRLVATPEYLEAAEWAKNEMEKWGLENVRLEPIDSRVRGWAAESFSMEMIEPRYSPIHTSPAVWTQSTEGDVIGVPVIIDYQPVDSLRNYHGKLNGKIIFWNDNYKTGPHFDSFTTRFTNRDLKSAELNINANPEESLSPWFDTRSIKEKLSFFEEFNLIAEEYYRFFIEENVAAIVFASDFDHGILHVDDHRTTFSLKGDVKAIPTFVISNEQFSRIARMKNKGIKPVLKLHLKTKFYDEAKYTVNIFSEIPGRDKKLSEEIVMLGAHFDSWYGGTGATDNGAGSAVMMEAMRILKTIEVKPRRTILLALWTGEEQGYLGSLDYTKKYVGDIFTCEKVKDPKKISVYFNLDNGSGKIRGIFLQGNEAVRNIFTELLAPFSYLEANTLAIQNVSNTDHRIFDGLNIPSFQFIQDPLNYTSVTHHTNMDVFEYVIEDDLKQNAVIVASLAYHIAMRDKMLPGKADNINK